MRRVLSLVAAAALPLAMGLLGAPAANAAVSGNSTAAHECQNGGYAKYQRADGTLFSNEDACTSYAAHGGTLTPIPAAPPAVGLTFTPTGSPYYCEVNLSLQHFAPLTTYPTQATVPGFGTFAGPTVTTDSNGSYTGGAFTFTKNNTVSVLVGGVTSPTQTIAC